MEIHKKYINFKSLKFKLFTPFSGNSRLEDKREPDWIQELLLSHLFTKDDSKKRSGSGKHTIGGFVKTEQSNLRVSTQT